MKKSAAVALYSRVIPFPVFNVRKCQFIPLLFNAFFEQKIALATGNGMTYGALERINFEKQHV